MEGDSQPTTPRCAGPLKKKGAGAFSGWAVRYFVLRGQQLCYSEDSTCSKVKGSIDIRNATVSQPSTMSPRGGFVFVLEGPYTTRKYELQADNEEMRIRWMRAIQQASVLHESRQRMKSETETTNLDTVGPLDLSKVLEQANLASGTRSRNTSQISPRTSSSGTIKPPTDIDNRNKVESPRASSTRNNSIGGASASISNPVQQVKRLSLNSINNALECLGRTNSKGSIDKPPSPRRTSPRSPSPGRSNSPTRSSPEPSQAYLTKKQELERLQAQLQEMDTKANKELDDKIAAALGSIKGAKELVEKRLDRTSEVSSPSQSSPRQLLDDAALDIKIQQAKEQLFNARTIVQNKINTQESASSPMASSTSSPSIEANDDGSPRNKPRGVMKTGSSNRSSSPKKVTIVTPPP